MSNDYVNIKVIDDLTEGGISGSMKTAITEVVDSLNQIITGSPGPNVPIIFRKQPPSHFRSSRTIAHCHSQHLKVGPTATKENAKKVDPYGLRHYDVLAPWPTIATISFNTLYDDQWNYKFQHYYATPNDNFVRTIILHEILHVTFDRDVFVMNDLMKYDSPTIALPNRWFVGEKAIKVHDDLYEEYPELQKQLRGIGIPLSPDGAHFAPHSIWYDGKICVPGVSMPVGSETPDPHPVMAAYAEHGTLDRGYFTQLEEAVFLDLGFTVNSKLVTRHQVDEQLISVECGCSRYNMYHDSTEHLQNKLYLEGEPDVKIGKVRNTSAACKAKVTPKFTLSEIQRVGYVNKHGFAGTPHGSCCFCLDAFLYRKSKRTGKITQILGNGYSYRYVPDGKLYDGSSSPFVFEPGQTNRDSIFVEFPERDESYYHPEVGDSLVFKYGIAPCGSPYIDLTDEHPYNQEGFGDTEEDQYWPNFFARHLPPTPYIPSISDNAKHILWTTTDEDMEKLMKLYGLEKKITP